MVFRRQQRPRRENREGAGVAYIINNKWKQYIIDIRPYSERIIVITLRTQPIVPIINVHIPAATQEHEEKIQQGNAMNN